MVDTENNFFQSQSLPPVFNNIFKLLSRQSQDKSRQVDETRITPNGTYAHLRKDTYARVHAKRYKSNFWAKKFGTTIYAVPFFMKLRFGLFA